MVMTQHEVLSKSGDGVSYLTGSLSGHGAGTGHAPALLDSSSLWGCRPRTDLQDSQILLCEHKE